MREFLGGKTTLGIQLIGFAIRENRLRRRLWLHTADLRLPLVPIWRIEIPGKIGADPFKRLTDIRENSLFHQLPTHPKIQRRRVREIDIDVTLARRLGRDHNSYGITGIDD